MNIILITPAEASRETVTLTDTRANHLRTFLHAAPGSTFRVGILDGPCGTATVTDVNKDGVTFVHHCTDTAPAPWYDMILALPRPRSFKRILFQAAAMGVRRIFVVGAEKVEKSYFSMHLLRPEEYTPVLIEGLMQAKTTALPRLTIVPKLRDLWDILPSDNGLRLIANPAPAADSLPSANGIPLIAIGPDGGWTDRENASFADHGFLPVTLGLRPLRTDTAAIALPAVIQDRLMRLSF